MKKLRGMTPPQGMDEVAEHNWRYRQIQSLVSPGTYRAAIADLGLDATQIEFSKSFFSSNDGAELASTLTESQRKEISAVLKNLQNHEPPANIADDEEAIADWLGKTMAALLTPETWQAMLVQYQLRGHLLGINDEQG